MLHLKTLIYNNIGRFTEEQRIDFHEHDNLLLIDGPSGVGKSTIFHSLDYLLGINSIAATQLQCRFTTKPMYAKGFFETSLGPIEIERNKKTGLTITLQGETISGNVELAEAKLDEIIGIPRKLFQKMIHKPQRDFGFFLQMTSKQMYEFLIEILGLKKYQDCIEVISEQTKEDTKTIGLLEASISSLSKGLLEIKGLRELQQSPELTIDPSIIDILKPQKDSLTKEIQHLIQERQEKVSEIALPIKVAAQCDYTQLQVLKERLSSLEEQKRVLVQSTINQRRLVDNQLQQANTQLYNIDLIKTSAKTVGLKIQELNKQKKDIESHICPTCRHSWENEEQDIYLRDLNSQIEENVKKALSYRDEVKKEPLLTEEVNNLRFQLESLQEPDTSIIDKQITILLQEINTENNKINNLQREVDSQYLQQHNAYLAKKADIDSFYLSKKDELEKKQVEIQNIIDLNSRVLLEYNIKKDNYISKIKELDDLLGKKTLDLNQEQSKLEELKSKVIIAGETKRAIKTYTLQIFQETLDSIGESASNILGNIHNMSDSSIYFEGCKETKTGVIKDEVNAIISKEGENNVPIKTLSGGERTVVDLAVDLAVIGIIEDRVGKGANFFIIDEPFDGLDVDGKEQYLEVIKSLMYTKDSVYIKQIILVDHSPELKEMVSDIIKINK